MKKLISIVLTVALSAFAFAGCSASGAEGESGSGSDFRVGAIYINSQNDTSGYTYAHHKGITEAMTAAGLDPATDLSIVDNVPEDAEQVTAACDQLAGEGCDIIFGISFGYIDAMEAAAAEYPDIIFSHATGYKSNSTNFNNYFGRIYQARYLAGIAAGYKSLALGNNEIGYVSAWGTEYAETCSGINAFALGCQSVNPDAHVNVYEIYTWGDQDLERQAAETLIDTFGCCVIAQHCDSAQPQIVANEKGVFGCGYNSDMTAEAPDAHLCAPIWNWSAYYQTAIEAAMSDPSAFMSTVGNYYEGINSGLVAVSELSANNEPAAQEAIDIATDLMKTGAWDVFSGTALSFTGDAGSVAVTENAADLLDSDGNVIVAAGGASVEDGVIQGSMNYYVAGVTQVNAAEG
ncbi:MAG: BMP family ABC transporter substrate-binding protein [Saccharofermentans sp.]|nr:BMP family ABC transporter substrate-binding protein [Saccharofermentans sp.]